MIKDFRERLEVTQHWYDYTDDMVKYSTQYPHLVFKMCGEGEEAGPGEWIALEHSEPTLHSFYTDDEPDIYFERKFSSDLIPLTLFKRRISLSPLLLLSTRKIWCISSLFINPRE